MIEVLNQGLFDPMPVEEQVAVIFAGNQGYVDDLDVSRVSTFCEGLREYLRSESADLLAAIREEKVLSAENEERLRATISDYYNSFAAEADVAELELEEGGA
jgi:F-type H+-transporting ATPase subunit alpha